VSTSSAVREFAVFYRLGLKIVTRARWRCCVEPVRVGGRLS
jgi:hypothetical protein